MNQKSMDKDDLFEVRLLDVLINLPGMHNGLGNVAAALEALTERKWNKKKLFYMQKGEGYAQKWQMEAMLKFALMRGWMPENKTDWKHIIWTLTGKKQAVEGGYNGEIYRMMAYLSNKPEIIFEQNFNKILEDGYGKQ